LDKRIVLPFGNANLTLESDGNWSTLYLEEINGKIRLGEESLSDLKEKFLDTLGDIPNRKLKTYMGIDNTFYVTTLVAPLASMVASLQTDGSVEIYWSNKPKEFPKIATLTKEEVKQFVNNIRELNFI